MSRANKISMGMALVLLMILLGIAFFSQNGYIDYRQLKAQKQALIEDNEQTRWNNWELRRRAHRLKTDFSYVEYVARRDFGMVGKNDLIYKLDNSKEGR